ncbi:hypothetical protein JCM3765_000592 [Sporobolomyces pararoseus]
MPSSGSTDPTSRTLYLSNLDQTNSLISLANSPNPSLAVSRLSNLLDTSSSSQSSSFATSTPTFEVLNRITFSYALLRTGQFEKGKQEMIKVGEMLEIDQGRTEYFSKVRERAKIVVKKRKLGIIKGINDREYTTTTTGNSSTKTTKGKESVPLDQDLLLDFSDLNLSTSSEREDEQAKGGVVMDQ